MSQEQCIVQKPVMLVTLVYVLALIQQRVHMCRLQVPGLNLNNHVTPGDLHLGVLHKILQPNPDERHCSPTEDHVVSSLLQICEAAVFAAKEINSKQDLLPNITLGLVCTDTCSKPLTGLGRAVYLVEDHLCPVTDDQCDPVEEELQHRRVVGVIGPGYSRVAVVVSSFFSLFQIPLLGTYASSDELSDKSRYEYFMRLVPPDRFQAQAFIDIILNFNWSYVGLMYSEGSYGEHGAKYIETLVAKHNLCLAFSKKLSVAGHVDEIDEVLDTLDTFKMARVVIWFIEGPVIARFLKAFEERGTLPNHVMLLSDSASKEVSNYPLAVRGCIVIDFVFHIVPGFFDYLSSLVPGNNTYNTWLKLAWEEKFQCKWSPRSNNSCSDFQPPKRWYGDIRYGINYYEGTYVFAHALHNLITSKCPRAFQNKQLLLDCIKGPELLETMKNSSIDILSGPILFDENGDRLAKYQLYHYTLDDTGRQVEVEVATWDKYSRSLEILTDRIDWSHLKVTNMTLRSKQRTDVFIPESLCSKECEPKQYKIQRSPHCCWECRYCRSNERLAQNKTICITCPDFTWPDEETSENCLPISPDYLHWNSDVVICLTCFAMTGAILSMAFIVIFWKNASCRLIKASNTELSFIMLFGAILAFLVTMSFFDKPSQAICYIRDVGFHAVVTMLYAPLLVKTCKIYCIFKAGKKGKKTPKFVTGAGQRVMITIAILIQICILVGVKLACPSDTTQRMPVATEPYVEQTCVQERISFLLPLAYNVIFILVCGMLGYGCRKLPENFNESGFIFVSVSTTIFAWVVFLPTYFTAYSTKHQALTLALCLLLNAYITIGCLFAPKIYALYCVDESEIKFAAKSPQSVGIAGTVSVAHTTVHRIEVKPVAED